MPGNPLAYAEFHELVAIAGKHWDPLIPALGRKRETLPLLERFNRLRNTVAHSRDTLSFENDLLAGIAGEIRNRVTKYMSDQSPGGDFFARIESAVDDLGYEAEPTGGDAGRLTCATGATLRVGDIVSFTCRAVDPEDGAIRWRLKTDGMGRRVVGEGDDVTIIWHVTDVDVGASTKVQIEMASDSHHYRYGFGSMIDGVAVFWYTVLPATAS